MCVTVSKLLIQSVFKFLCAQVIVLGPEGITKLNKARRVVYGALGL